MFPRERFNWDSYQAYGRAGPSGQRPALTLSLRTGSDSFEQQIVGLDSRGRLGPQHRGLPAAGPCRRHGRARLLTPLPTAWPNGSRKLRRGPVLGRSRHLCRRRTATTSFYGFFYKVNVKSLVWYVPENFEDAGYEVPETMEELKALTEQIVADGETPWCIGLGSGAATGWPATDWVEDMMLRTQPPEVYDGGCPTRSRSTIPRVVRDRGIRLVRPQRRFVAGGAGTVATTDFRDSPEGPLRLAAAVLHAPPGVVHPGLLPRRHRGRRRGLLLLPGLCRARTSATRFSVAAR
jgi:alpha-glucoside transport system substrate-binding protein